MEELQERREPTHNVFLYWIDEDGETHDLRIGEAYEHTDGSGFSLIVKKYPPGLDNGQVMLRDKKVSEHLGESAEVIPLFDN